MLPSTDYTFHLPAFEGPLDLLLRLIERRELDITAIALAEVADEYLAHVRALDQRDPAALSAFLSIATRLLLIKSRALLPRPPPPASDEELDDADALVRQLQQYQRFKQAATLLRSWESQGRRSFTRSAPPPAIAPPPPERLDVTLAQMIAAWQRRAQLLLPLTEASIPLPQAKTITVTEMVGRIRGRLATQPWFQFDDLLSAALTRVELVVALWSVLELLKRRAIVVEQEALFGPIMVGRGPNLTDGALHELTTDY